jgi:DNA repair protein RecN (Recombination protein N)
MTQHPSCLKDLKIRHIILVDAAHLSFDKGLHIISGETGSGKSAILESLALILGQRADSQVVRQGESKGGVEGVFDIDALPHLHDYLQEMGIAHERGEYLIIRREIFASGKSLATINDQNVTVATLRMVGKHLVKFIGQHATQELLDPEMHRRVYDSYIGVEEELVRLSKAWTKERAIAREIDNIVNSESQRIRLKEVCQREIEEIEQVRPKEGEDDALFAEYSKLCHGDELASYLGNLLGMISESDQSVLPALKSQRFLFEKMVKLDNTIAPLAKGYQSVLAELEEVAYGLKRYQSQLDHDPYRAQEINERLTQLNKIKKKYGATVSQVMQYLEETKRKLLEIDGTEERLEGLRRDLDIAREETEEIARKVSHKRSKACNEVSKAVMGQLRELNMPHAVFEVRLEKQARSSTGDETIMFFMAPNEGEKMIPVHECASGGELARLMLAFQVLLSGKEQIPTVIFDEIDANIGGETASIVGDKLREIGGNTQVVCITHFPQVALCADHHYQISKHNKNGRTLSQVQKLDDVSKEGEIKRMYGGKRVKH